MKITNLGAPPPSKWTIQYVDNMLNIDTLDEVLKAIEQNNIEKVEFLVKKLKQRLEFKNKGK